MDGSVLHSMYLAGVIECVWFAPWSNRLHLYTQAVGIHRLYVFDLTNLW